MTYIVKSNSTFEYEEKKSKFISRLFIIKNIAQASEIISEIKENEIKANHNCWAYRVKENGIIHEGKSDDGEPKGTAGAPMLNVLSKENIINVLVVITRYFGGIKLGTGGLVKAYQKGVTNSIKESIKEEYIEKNEVKIKFRIEKTNQLNHLLATNNITPENKDFSGKNVTYTLSLDEKGFNIIKKVDYLTILQQ